MRGNGGGPFAHQPGAVVADHGENQQLVSHAQIFQEVAVELSFISPLPAVGDKESPISWDHAKVTFDAVRITHAELNVVLFHESCARIEFRTFPEGATH